MKREAFNHSKILRLARYLEIPVWGARGILESLWIVTEGEAPRGDIGKLANEDIAIRIGWTEDPERLIGALIDADLLDADSDSRITVHDWSEHAADGVHSRLARAGVLFADGKPPKTSKLSKEDRAVAEKKIKSALRRIPAHSGALRQQKAAAGSNAVPYLTSPNQASPHPAGRVGPPTDLVRSQAECRAALSAAVIATGIPADELLPRASRPKGSASVISRIDTCARAEWLDATRDRLIGIRLQAEDAAPQVDKAQATDVTLTFYEKHGWPHELARTCAAYVRLNSGTDQRAAIDKWLNVHEAPNHVRIEVIRGTFAELKKEANVQREHATDGTPADTAAGGGNPARVHQAPVVGVDGRVAGGALDAGGLPVAAAGGARTGERR